MSVRREGGKKVSTQLSNYVKYALIISSQTELNWSIFIKQSSVGRTIYEIIAHCLSLFFKAFCLGEDSGSVPNHPIPKANRSWMK